MRKVVFAVVTVALFLVGSVLTSHDGEAGPPQPHNLFGLARESDGVTPLPRGTPISTWIDGVAYGNATAVFNDTGGYDIDTFGNWITDGGPNTPEVKEGGDVGDPILVAAGNFTTFARVFTARPTWSPGAVANETLQLAPPGNQPRMIKIGRIVTRPADGLSQYVYLCNPTSEFVTADPYYLQKDVPGRFDGPLQLLAGVGGLAPRGVAYVNLTGALTLEAAGDNLKLVWDNVGPAFGGADVVVDRVEFNRTGGPGTLFWEPGNTIMTDAAAPGLGQEIRRSVGCLDTNDNAADFTLAGETGRPTATSTPSVALVSPDGGEDWTGGTVHRIVWNMADAQDASLEYAIHFDASGGTGGFPTLVAAGSAVTGTGKAFDWTVDRVNTTAARIRVCVVDTDRLTACDASAANLSIDSAPPTVVAAVPAQGAADVSVLADFVVTFSEPMNRTAVQTAIALVPSPGPLSFTWNATSMVLTISHAPLSVNTPYTLSVTSAARDASNPGNVLANLPAIRFTTSAAASVTANAGPDRTVRLGETVRLNGSGSTGPIANYTWRVASRTGASLVLFGVEPSFTPDEAGVYTVNLTVRDAAGNSNADEATLSVLAAAPGEFLVRFWWVFALIAASVLAALLGRRRLGRREEAKMPPPVPPERVEVTPPPARREAPPPPPAPAGPQPGPRPGTKVCPACGTIVDAGDPTCFMCGTKL